MNGGDYCPEGKTIVFPDLASLTPAITSDRYARVGARLVAFYEAVSQQCGRSETPYVGGVWVSPGDYDRLRAWVEWPIRRIARQTRGIGWFWLDKGPSVSRYVPDGKIIVTGDAYPDGTMT